MPINGFEGHIEPVLDLGGDKAARSRQRGDDRGTGRSWVIASLVSAGLALAVTPVVFRPLGVIAGIVAAWKGAKLWGTAEVSASFVAAVVSIYLAGMLMA